MGMASSTRIKRELATRKLSRERLADRRKTWQQHDALAAGRMAARAGGPNAGGPEPNADVRAALHQPGTITGKHTQEIQNGPFAWNKGVPALRHATPRDAMDTAWPNQLPHGTIGGKRAQPRALANADCPRSTNTHHSTLRVGCLRSTQRHRRAWDEGTEQFVDRAAQPD